MKIMKTEYCCGWEQSPQPPPERIGSLWSKGIRNISQVICCIAQCHSSSPVQLIFPSAQFESATYDLGRRVDRRTPEVLFKLNHLMILCSESCLQRHFYISDCVLPAKPRHVAKLCTISILRWELKAVHILSSLPFSPLYSRYLYLELERVCALCRSLGCMFRRAGPDLDDHETLKTTAPEAWLLRYFNM